MVEGPNEKRAKVALRALLKKNLILKCLDSGYNLIYEFFSLWLKSIDLIFNEISTQNFP